MNILTWKFIMTLKCAVKYLVSSLTIAMFITPNALAQTASNNDPVKQSTSRSNANKVGAPTSKPGKLAYKPMQRPQTEAKPQTATFMRHLEENFPNDKVELLKGGSGAIIAGIIIAANKEDDRFQDRKKVLKRRLEETFPNNKVELLEGGSGLIIALLA